MKQTKIIMGMPITVEVLDKGLAKTVNSVFDYFEYVDNKFSTYKKKSEISLINQGKIKKNQFSSDMRKVFSLAEKTKFQTNGYFDIVKDGHYDPSGIVKGWAIYQAANLLKKNGVKNFYIDAGGDVQTLGKNQEGQNWRVGIKNPFNQQEVVKVLSIENKGVATSGTYIRGSHIYNPKGDMPDDYVSLTVIGTNILEADRFATAAFAMGKQGIYFIESLKGFEGYIIDRNGLATKTSGFEKYVIHD